MKRFPLMLTGFVTALTLAGATIASAHCGSCDAGAGKAAEPCKTCEKHAAQQAPTYTLTLGMSGYSPVSYLDQHKAEPGSPRFAAVYQGVTYFFVSAEQRSAFEKNPERYMPAYGGYCAFGCSVDSQFVPDPTSFEIINGRTHLFLKNKEVDAKALWRDGNQAELLRKADAYWNKQSHAKDAAK